MSELTITCPHCSQEVLADTDYAGQALSCPTCNGEFMMPEVEAPSGAPTIKAQTPGGVPAAPILQRRGKSMPKPTGAQTGPASTPTVQALNLPGSQGITTGSTAATTNDNYDPFEVDSGPSGFSRLFYDPVTGQRQACDEMEAGRPLLLGFLLMILIGVGVSYAASQSLGIDGFASFAGGAFSTALIPFLLAFSIWVIGEMSNNKIKFGEGLLVSCLAIIWFLLFAVLAFLLGSLLDSSSILEKGFSALPLVLGMIPYTIAVCSFFAILYGSLRNLCGASGPLAFWCTPLIIVMTSLAYFAYVMLLGEVAMKHLQG